MLDETGPTCVAMRSVAKPRWSSGSESPVPDDHTGTKADGLMLQNVSTWLSILAGFAAAGLWLKQPSQRFHRHRHRMAGKRAV